MTVVLALSCNEGIGLASDSQETVGQTRNLVRKLWDVDGRLAWGAAGESSLTERLVALSTTFRPHLDAAQFVLANEISGVTTQLQRLGVNGYVALPNTQTPMLAGLFCWCEASGTPRIYQVEPTGSHSCFRANRAAIGSGGPFAQVALASVAHLRTHELDLERLKMVAYKALQDVINTSSWGVGWPIQMYTITPGGGAESLGLDALRGIGDSVTAWMEEQRRVLGSLGGAPEGEPPEEVVAPADDPGLEPDDEPQPAEDGGGEDAATAP